MSTVEGTDVRISQLAAASDVAVPTIKFYLREGLLAPGLPTATNQAEYDEAHVRRLRLIRSLVNHAELSISETRRLLAALDDPPPSAHELLGMLTLGIQPTVAAEPEARAETVAVLQAVGWDLSDVHPQAIDAVAVALAHLRSAGVEFTDRLLHTFIDAAQRIARAEIEEVPTDSPDAAVAYVIVGTVLAEPLMLALRRLAEQVESSRVFATSGLPQAESLPSSSAGEGPTTG